MLQHNGLTLAYLGDAVYELLIRTHLIEQGFTKVDQLHKQAIQYTCATGQHRAFRVIEPLLSETEIGVFKRGRNAKTERKAKNQSLSDYRQATGFEALIGYLYLQHQQERLNVLVHTIVSEGQ